MGVDTAAVQIADGDIPVNSGQFRSIRQVGVNVHHLTSLNPQINLIKSTMILTANEVHA